MFPGGGGGGWAPPQQLGEGLEPPQPPPSYASGARYSIIRNYNIIISKFLFQVSVLQDQIDAQQEKILELEQTLEQKKAQLAQTEEILQKVRVTLS